VNFEHQYAERSFRGIEKRPDGTVKTVLVVVAKIDLNDPLLAGDLEHAAVEYIRTRPIDSIVFCQG
jgi:hypothetical protein